MEHPAGIRDCFQELQNRKIEFKLKVDKAQTVPYTVMVDQLEKEACVLTFQRPLPPELLKGALFVGNFQMEGHNFQAHVKFVDRSAYLRYRFTFPEKVSKMERRKAPRLPFRPREKAFVTLRDGGVPGLGASGPLLNLGSLGLAMRVDRVIRLDTGLRLAISGGHFPPDKYFSAVRLEELPGLPSLDLKGFAVHATEKGGILMLGLLFQEPPSEIARQLEEVLKLRTKLLAAKGPSLGPSDSAPAALRKAPGPAPTALEAPASWDAPDVLNEAPPDDSGEGTAEDLDPLRLLQRRCLPLLLVAPEPEQSQELAAWLREHGYRRLGFAPKAGVNVPPGTLVLDPLNPAQPDHLPLPALEAWDRDLLPLLDQRAQERV